LGAYEKKTILDEVVFILFLCYIAAYSQSMGFAINISHAQ
jgi:hypothetical protein